MHRFGIKIFDDSRMDGTNVKKKLLLAYEINYS